MTKRKEFTFDDFVFKKSEPDGYTCLNEHSEHCVRGCFDCKNCDINVKRRPYIFKNSVITNNPRSLCSDLVSRNFEIFYFNFGEAWIVKPTEIVLVDRNGNKKIVNKKIYNKRTKKLDN